MTLRYGSSVADKSDRSKTSFNQFPQIAGYTAQDVNICHTFSANSSMGITWLVLSVLTKFKNQHQKDYCENDHVQWLKPTQKAARVQIKTCVRKM